MTRTPPDRRRAVRWSRFALAAVLATAVGPAAPLRGHDGPGGSGSVRPAPLTAVPGEMAAAAGVWWASLSPDQQKAANFAFDDAERLNWHFIPRVRKGLSIKDMSPGQRPLAWALLSTALSGHGMVKAQQITSLEAYLKEVEPGPPASPLRDPENYAFTVFGTPAPTGTWGWRFEGHHVSVNVTIVGGTAVTALPTFMGNNPGEIRTGPRAGLRVLAAEEDLGRRLVTALTPAQRATAVLSGEAPKDIASLADRNVDLDKVTGKAKGLSAADMTPEQRDLLLQLLEEYARRHRVELADQEMRKIHVAGFDKVCFAWIGGLEPRVGHYYRIHGPTFLVEYDNTQNTANHIHTVWRDPANDFGLDVLKRHYETDAEHAGKPKG